MTTASVMMNTGAFGGDIQERFVGVQTGVTDVNTDKMPFIGNVYGSKTAVPYLIPNIMQGVMDDPVVVSDDNPTRDLDAWRTSTLNAIRSQLAPNSVRTGLHDEIITQWDLIPQDHLGQGNYFDALLGTLEPETRQRKANLVGNFASSATKSAWQSFVGIWDDFTSGSNEDTTMRKVRAVLEPVFVEADFEATSTYGDGIGGLVIDFLNLEQRITVILDSDRLQFLYVEEDEIVSTIFENASSRLADIYSFSRRKFA